MARHDDDNSHIGLDRLGRVILAARLITWQRCPDECDRELAPSAVTLANSMGRPIAGSLGLQGGSSIAIASAMAARVTVTAVPSTVRSQMGAVAGPRLVSIGPVVNRAAVILRGVQSPHGSNVPALIAATACCAEISATGAVVPSCQRTSPSDGVVAGRLASASTKPAISARLLLSPTAGSQTPTSPGQLAD